MKATVLSKEQYRNFPEFDRYGIDLSLTHADVILTLQSMREASDIPIWPGPNQDNWGRVIGSKTSRHYAGKGPSLAGDIFPKRGRALELWKVAMDHQQVGGLGLYLDTNGPDGKFWIMLHFDLRYEITRELWTRRDGVYTLHKEAPDLFWNDIKIAILLEQGYRAAQWRYQI